MIRLYVLVEGQTEEGFVKTVLVPHLEQFAVHANVIIVATSREASGRKRRGGGAWKQWAEDLKRLIASQRGPNNRFTTMFDLYGLPADFPGMVDHGTDPDSRRRVATLTAAMERAVNDHRFVGYLQRHEFESLVLASLDSLARFFDRAEDRAGIQALRRTLETVPPEDVNDGETTAPSKRLQRLLPSYRKILHGVPAVPTTGLVELRNRCPSFDAWIKRLEVFGTTSN